MPARIDNYETKAHRATRRRIFSLVRIEGQENFGPKVAPQSSVSIPMDLTSPRVHTDARRGGSDHRLKKNERVIREISSRMSTCRHRTYVRPSRVCGRGVNVCGGKRNGVGRSPKAGHTFCEAGACPVAYETGGQAGGRVGLYADGRAGGRAGGQVGRQVGRQAGRRAGRRAGGRARPQLGDDSFLTVRCRVARTH